MWQPDVNWWILVSAAGYTWVGYLLYQMIKLTKKDMPKKKWKK